MISSARNRRGRVELARLGFVLAAGVIMATSGCSGASGRASASAGASASPGGDPAPSASATVVPAGYPTPVACDDAGFLALAARHPSGYTEVTVCGTVTSVLPEKTTASGLHKYFTVRVDARGDAIEIVTNIDETGEFAVKPGDTADVHGRYYDDNPSSQGIDWTHHDSPGASWPYPGYVRINGGPLVS